MSTRDFIGMTHLCLLLDLCFQATDLLLELVLAPCRLLHFRPELVCAVFVGVQVLQLQLELLHLLRFVLPQLLQCLQGLQREVLTVVSILQKIGLKKLCGKE